MFISSFNIKCIVHFEFIPQGHTVIQAYYVEVLKWLHETVHRERPELWPNNWILHYDNAPTHKALSVKQFLVQKLLSETEHPPYSPDLALNDFWLFPKVCLKGMKISGYLTHPEKCDMESYSRTGVPKTFPIMSVSLG